MKLIRPGGISYLGIFVLWDKIYHINGVIRSYPEKQSYKVKILYPPEGIYSLMKTVINIIVKKEKRK